MTLQPTASAQASTARPGATQAAQAMAAVRLGIGAVGLLAPGRLAWRLFLPGRPIDEATTLVLRGAAARDLALGLGAALASQRGPRTYGGRSRAGAGSRLAARRRTRRLLRCAHRRVKQVSKPRRTCGDRAGRWPVRQCACAGRPAAHAMTLAVIGHGKSSVSRLGRARPPAPAAVQSIFGPALPCGLTLMERCRPAAAAGLAARDSMGRHFGRRRDRVE